MPVSHAKAAFGALALVFAVGLTGIAPAAAQEAYGPRIVHLSVIDRDTGQTKKVYLHDRRYYVSGDTGRRYSLRVENVSSAFRFAPLPQSYAARTGRPGEVGVIGMAVFRERRVPPPVVEKPRYRRSDRSGAPPPMPAPPPPPSPMLEAPGSETSMARAAVPPPAQAVKLGTAHGEIEGDAIRIEQFERASARPDSVRLLEYDSLDNLVAAGVIPAGSPETRRPQPFPGRSDPTGYVPDPPPARY